MSIYHEGNRRYQETERALLTDGEAEDLKRLLRRLLGNAAA